MKKTNIANKFTVFSDINALLIYSCFYSLLFFSSVFTVVLGYIVQPDSSLIFLASALFICCAVVGVALIIGARKWAATITISEKGIYIKPFLKKGYSKSFDELQFITKAWRSRSSRLEIESLRKYYIVISNYELSDYERSKINYLSNSENAIKIEFDKKNYDALLSILPESHRIQLESQFSDMIQ